MDKKIFDGFYEKFDVLTRKGRGGHYPYVKADDITNRMNQLFQGNWCSEVISQDTDPTGAVVVSVRVSVLDPITDKWFYHEGFGGHRDEGGEPGNVYKSAYSKALVNACRRWGVGLYLDDEATANNPSQSGPSGTPAPIPPEVKSIQPSAQTGPPKTAISQTGLPPAPAAGPPVSNQVTVQQVESPPVDSAPPAQGLPKMAAPPMHGAPLNGQKPSVDKPAPPKTSVPASIPTTTMSVPNTDAISDVQKIAIQSLYDMRGYKYEDLATSVLGNAPDINTLTHEQAVGVIQYGNELYKKSKTN